MKPMKAVVKCPWGDAFEALMLDTRRRTWQNPYESGTDSADEALVVHKLGYLEWVDMAWVTVDTETLDGS